MKTISIDSWRQYPDAIAQIRREVKALSSGYFSQLLYRGQADSQWKLTTTLDRFLRPHLSVFTYLAEAQNACRPIASHTSRTFDEEAFGVYRNEVAELKLGERLPLPSLGLMSYLIYLRQFGFPSPLLDWTESPWIAAYFAFRVPQPAATECAVFVIGDVSKRDADSERPQLLRVGPMVPTDKRHFTQQAQYTIAVTPPSTTSDWRFADHESAFATSGEGNVHGWKILLPASLRPEALDHLQDFNLNAFTLFGTEEALLESIAHRYIGRLRYA